MFAYKCCHRSSETYSRGGRWEVMSYSDTEENSIFTLIAVPIIITFISTAGIKERVNGNNQHRGSECTARALCKQTVGCNQGLEGMNSPLPPL